MGGTTNGTLPGVSHSDPYGGSGFTPPFFSPGVGCLPIPGESTRHALRRETPSGKGGGGYPQGTLGWGAPDPDRVVGSKDPCLFLPGGEGVFTSAGKRGGYGWIVPSG